MIGFADEMESTGIHPLPCGNPPATAAVERDSIDSEEKPCVRYERRLFC